MLRDTDGQQLILVHVHVTDPLIRFERSRYRSETRDPASFERFLRQDEAAEELFDLQETISMANLTINHDGPLEELYPAVEELAIRYGLSPLRGPRHE